MSRESLQQKQAKSTNGKMAQVDVDAEHDPKASRRASNAALNREAGKAPAADAAERGVKSPSTALPHADKIQRAFGAHDVSNIKAHVGDRSADEMGAEAYATGNHVVFGKEPDLHTAAHEAAHVVQQAQGVNLKGGVGKAGDPYERSADAVADRVVQGKSAEDLLGAPTKGSAQGGVVQAKPKDDQKTDHKEENHKDKEAPTQAQADSAVINAVQTHVKLVAARMHASALKVREHLKSPSGGDAGHAPMMMQIEAEIGMVNSDLDNVNAEIMHASKLMGGALGPELGALNGAFHESWAPALNSVWWFTRDHEKDDKLYDWAVGFQISLTPSQDKVREIFRTAGVDPTQVTSVMAPRLKEKGKDAEQREEELIGAEMEALKSGMSAVDIAVDLINADLHGSTDQSKEVLDLQVSLDQLVAVLEPISPDHIGKLAKLPILITKVETLRNEVRKMRDADSAKGKALAPKLVDNPTLATDLRRLRDQVQLIDGAHKAKARHH